MTHKLNKSVLFTFFILIILLFDPIIILKKAYHYLSYPIFALFISFIHEMFINFFAKFQVNRRKSIIIIICLEIAILSLLILFFIPFFYNHFIEFIYTLYHSVDQVLSTIQIRYHILLEWDRLIDINLIMNYLFNLLSKLITSFKKIFVIYCFSIYINFKSESLYSLLNQKIQKLIYTYYQHLKVYFKSYILLMIVQILINGVLFLLFKHPYWLILSLLSGLFSIIPYFGATLINIISILTFQNFKLLWLLVICEILLSNLDNYVITPKIYSYHFPFSNLTIIMTMYLFNLFFSSSSLILVVPTLIFVDQCIDFKKKAS